MRRKKRWSHYTQESRRCLVRCCELCCMLRCCELEARGTTPRGSRRIGKPACWNLSGGRNVQGTYVRVSHNYASPPNGAEHQQRSYITELRTHQEVTLTCSVSLISLPTGCKAQDKAQRIIRANSYCRKGCSLAPVRHTHRSFEALRRENNHGPRGEHEAIGDAREAYFECEGDRRTNT